jgi:hypothetical protein
MEPTIPVPQQISYNVKQASAATGLSDYAIRHAIREGKLAARYLGDKILIEAESLVLFIRSLPSERQVHRDCAATERGVA